jgi:hypothetical protein
LFTPSILKIYLLKVVPVVRVFTPLATVLAPLIVFPSVSAPLLDIQSNAATDVQVIPTVPPTVRASSNLQDLVEDPHELKSLYWGGKKAYTYPVVARDTTTSVPTVY